MAAEAKYRRVLLKISGERLCSPGGFGIEAEALGALVGTLGPLKELGVQAGVVVGAGNFVRGRDLAGSAHSRPITADYMGMVATVINALALADALQARGQDAVVLSAGEMSPACEPFAPDRAIEHLEQGRLLVLAGGTGSPFFTTDTCASLRARQIGAEVLLKATKVDGVFEADPVTSPGARKYERLSYEKVLADRLGVMDAAAVAMCMDAGLPIVVFVLARPGNLAAAIRGEAVGTIISA